MQAKWIKHDLDYFPKFFLSLGCIQIKSNNLSIGKFYPQVSQSDDPTMQFSLLLSNKYDNLV